MSQLQTITLDGVQHQIADFGPDVQKLVDIFSTWQDELVSQRLDVAKTEAALRSLDGELTGLISAELAARAAQAPEAEQTQPV